MNRCICVLIHLTGSVGKEKQHKMTVFVALIQPTWEWVRKAMVLVAGDPTYTHTPRRETKSCHIYLKETYLHGMDDSQVLQGALQEV